LSRTLKTGALNCPRPMRPAEEYVRQCAEHRVKKPNRDVITQLETADSLEEVELVDLSTTYVGWRGLLPVVELVAQCPNVSTLVCGQQNAELSSDNTAVGRLMEVVRGHPSLTSVSFAGNPVTAFGAHHLLTVAKENPQMLQIQLDDPLMDTKVLQRITEALEDNLRRASAAESLRRSSKPPSLEEGSPRNRRRTGVSAEVLGSRAFSDDYCPLTVPKDETVLATLRECLLKNPLFSHLMPGELERFVDVMYRTEWGDGDEIIQLGTPGENLYVLTKGEANVVKNGRVVAVKKESQIFGELELMYDTLACATVQAVGSVEAWAISRKDYQHVMIGEMTQRRQNHVEFLSRIPITQHLHVDEKLQIADALQSENFADGAVVMRQGDRGDTMYIVVEGTAMITRTTEAGEVDLGTRTSGEYFGEFEFLFPVPRFCTVTAKGPLRTLYITKRDFEFSMGPVLDVLQRNTEVYRFYVADDGSPMDREAAKGPPTRAS